LFKHITYNNRKVLGYLFLFLFVFANTPKKILHDVVTVHQHTHHQEKKCFHKHIEITAKGFDCNTDNLVINIVYTITIHPTFLFSQSFFTSHSQQTLCNTALQKIQATHLRGPPVC
jgi:hypothetical protein